MPFIFSFKKNYKFEEGSDRIGELFSKEYRGCIKYRNIKTKKLDTYVSFIYGSYIVVLQLVGENLQIVDRIKLSKSLIYQKLSEYSL